MTSGENPFTARRMVRTGALIAGIALMVGTGQAQQADQAAAPTETAMETTATFVPSAEAQFETAFAHLPEPSLDPAIPAHAVDIDTIEPAAPDGTDMGEGIASFYGRKFHGRPTASGQAFDMNALTAAHRTLPFGSQVRVTNTANGKSVIVTVNDRGPFVRGREIDVSRAAAEQLGIVNAGHVRVALELING